MSIPGVTVRAAGTDAVNFDSGSLGVGADYTRATASPAGSWSQEYHEFAHTAARQSRRIEPGRAGQGRLDSFISDSNAHHVAGAQLYFSDSTPAALVLFFAAIWNTASDATTRPGTLFLKTDGNVEMRASDGTTTLATTTTPPFTDATWYPIMVTHDTAGSNTTMRVWKYENKAWVNFLSYTGVHADVVINCYFYSEGFEVGVDPAVTQRWDDWWTGSYTDEAALKTLLRYIPARASRYMPEAVGTSTDFNGGVGASPHPDVTNVDEWIPNDATDYDQNPVAAAGSPKRQTYTSADWSGATPTFLAVLQNSRARTVNSPAGNLYGWRTYVDSTGTESTGQAGNGVYDNWVRLMLVTPAGAEWTVALFNTIETGMWCEGVGSGSCRLSTTHVGLLHTYPIRTAAPTLMGLSPAIG